MFAKDGRGIVAMQLELHGSGAVGAQGTASSSSPFNQELAALITIIIERQNAVALSHHTQYSLKDFQMDLSL